MAPSRTMAPAVVHSVVEENPVVDSRYADVAETKSKVLSTYVWSEGGSLSRELVMLASVANGAPEDARAAGPEATLAGLAVLTKDAANDE